MRVAIVLLTLLLFAQPQASTISDAEEVRLGQVLADDFIEQEGMQPTPQTKKLDEYLQSVGDRVAVYARRKIPYRFRFDPSPSFRSAVGLPGGQVFVGAGILAYMDSEDQLAMVLGHEIEHIDLNQCRERLAKTLQEQHLTPATATKMKVDPFLPGYGKEGELAADREGVLLAMRAGYSGGGCGPIVEDVHHPGRQHAQLSQRSQREPGAAHRANSERNCGEQDPEARR
jgi:predicted Zn-dependent protease